MAAFTLAQLEQAFSFPTAVSYSRLPHPASTVSTSLPRWINSRKGTSSTPPESAKDSAVLLAWPGPLTDRLHS